MKRFDLLGRELHTTRVILFLVGIVICVSVDLIIKDQVEKHWVRPWSPDLIIQEDEFLVSFTNDPERTKLLVKEVTVIKDFWSFTYVRNYNIGFSLLSFIENYLSPKVQKIFFKILQLIALIIVIFFFLFYSIDSPYIFLLIISGGIGNVLDRWMRGYVVDYVKWYIKDSSIQLLNPWPIFNFADSLITVGIILLLIKMFFFNKREGNLKNKKILPSNPNTLM